MTANEPSGDAIGETLAKAGLTWQQFNDWTHEYGVPEAELNRFDSQCLAHAERFIEEVRTGQWILEGTLKNGVWNSYPDGRSWTDALHPTGQCTCAGAGECPWCLENRTLDNDAAKEMGRSPGDPRSDPRSDLRSEQRPEKIDEETYAQRWRKKERGMRRAILRRARQAENAGVLGCGGSQDDIRSLLKKLESSELIALSRLLSCNASLKLCNAWHSTEYVQCTLHKKHDGEHVAEGFDLPEHESVRVIARWT